MDYLTGNNITEDDAMKRTFLTKIRQVNQLESKEVARAMGITCSHYSRIESGVNNPSWEIGCKLGEFFGINACKLLKRDDEQ